MIKRFLYLVFLTCCCLCVKAQYVIQGSATQQSCHCYTLTPDSATKNGSVWNVNRIDLTQNFDIAFDIFVGCADANGADGIAFVLQQQPTATGGGGGGMGVQGINPSLNVVLDTYQNGADGDPAYDHISINRNGDISHLTANNLAGPVQAIFGNDNVEDCAWHLYRITWDAATKVVSVYFGGALRATANTDLVNNIFGGNPMVYWGMTGATGGLTNEQKFCARLNAGFASNLLGDSTCNGYPVQFTPFIDALIPVVGYYWDFGDGTTSTLYFPPPHVYPGPGVYNVKMVIKGGDGCISDTFRKQVFIMPAPSADFIIPPDACEDAPVRPQLITTNFPERVTSYAWYLDNVLMAGQNRPDPTFTFPPGLRKIELRITSAYSGCDPPPVVKFINIKPIADVISGIPAGCVNRPVELLGVAVELVPPITSWTWSFSNGATATGQSAAVTFTQAGNYHGELIGVSGNGCGSDTFKFSFAIKKATANAGNDTVVLANNPFLLNGTGNGDLFQWSPAFGLNDAVIPRPTGRLNDDTTYTLTVTTFEGCVATDAVHIKVFKGAQIFVPTAFTPNGDGRNELLKPAYTGIRDLRFNVYNRWGQLIFTSTDTGAGWDGTFKGKPQPAGNYVYVIRATDFIGTVMQKKGYFLLIK